MGIGAALLVAGLAFVIVKKMGDKKNKQRPQQYMQQGFGGGGYGAPPPPYGSYGGQFNPAAGSRDINASTGQPWTATPGPDMNAIMQSLIACINERRIGAFFPQGVDHIAQRVVATGAIQRVSTEWRLPQDVAIDLVKLALFDIVVLCDDSSSMAMQQGGERIEDLKQVLAKIAFASTLFDDDGIQIRFVNSHVQGNNTASEDDAVDLIDQVQFNGPKPLGMAMDQKILQPLVLGPLRQNALRKPVLVITITDGQPSGEPFGVLQQAIANTSQQLNSTPFGPSAVSYQFAQVGNDYGATQFLGALDNDPQVGKMIDATSDYDIEAREMMQKSGQQLTPIMWLLKMMLGGIDSSYDSQD